MGYPESPLGPASQPPGAGWRQLAESADAVGEPWVGKAAAFEATRRTPSAGVKLYSTCPTFGDANRSRYGRQVAEVARWCEDAGFQGILVYTDNSMMDPWLVAQIIIQNTETLSPLVAVQPAYMHPYTVAKMVTSLGGMYGRRLALNMVAGGFKNDLTALDDTTPHDQRYQRLAEYTHIIKKLLAGGPVTLKGEFYRVNNLKLSPPLAPDLVPQLFVSGSSEAGMDAARTLEATAVHYPQPASDVARHPPPPEVNCGIRVGIIARESEAAAWTDAHRRFPEDRKGRITHNLVMKVSDSSWHHQLSNLAPEAQGNGQGPYWLTPFANYKTFCPYLVGSYSTVARELARYMALGYETFILDIPPSREELVHTNTAFRLARGVAAQ
jgi:alkanesulfonate monooxygenase